MRTAILAFAVLSSLISFGAHGQGAAKTASAQDYPIRALRAIVPSVPGGGTDISARIVTVALGEALGKQIVVDNRPGGGGTLGVAIAARALPDGYTVLMGSIATHGINPALFKNLPYHPIRDFAPVSMIGTTPNVLVVHPSVPAATMREFIAYAKANPGKILYGSSGVGGSPHLAMELLKTMAGIDMLHVPYKGSGAVLTELLSGQIQTTSSSVTGQLPYIKSGKLRALAVTTTKRSAQLPDVPTVIESGIPGYEVTIWYAMFVPAAVPKPIIARLNAELVKVLNGPELKTRLAQTGIDAASSTPEELAAFAKAEVAKWTKVAKIAGVHPES
ncbi:MAG: tripartite tricarboxylate transporter substrate binding protein [Betaproteobacteria bacterium]|nr:tripartite tricarboxylate transporter substrate binding protein [Betaproteobacteria bacterium]